MFHSDDRLSETRQPPRTWIATLRQLGPGIIVAAAIVGSGELIATTKVGATAGFWLLWLVVIGCVIKVFTQVEFGRYAITWGETGLQALNDVPGPRWKVNWIVWYWALMTVLVVSMQGGIVGGVGQALAIGQPVTERGVAYNEAKDAWVERKVELALAQERQAPREEVDALARDVERMEADFDTLPEPADAYLWAVLLSLVTAVLMYVGRYRLIQSVATVLVAVFTLVTVVALILLQRTGWAVEGHEFAQGLLLRLPPVDATATENPVATALAAFGIIGLAAGELIMYPYWCLEKGYARYTGSRDGSASWTERARGWIRVLQADAWVSMVVYTFATVTFYLLGAAVLSRTGLDPSGADMIRVLGQMYVPVFGSWARVVFLVGAFAALYSTFFVVAAGYSRIVADGLGLFGLTDGSEEARARWTRYLSTAWPLVALAMYLFLRAPVAMVLAGGLAQSIMLPILGLAALYFRYRRSDPKLQSGRWWDVMLWLSFAALILIGGWSVYSVFFV